MFRFLFVDDLILYIVFFSWIIEKKIWFRKSSFFQFFDHFNLCVVSIFVAFVWMEAVHKKDNMFAVKLIL